MPHVQLPSYYVPVLVVQSVADIRIFKISLLNLLLKYWIFRNSGTDCMVLDLAGGERLDLLLSPLCALRFYWCAVNDNI